MLFVAEQIVIVPILVINILLSPEEYKKETGQSRVPRMCPQ